MLKQIIVLALGVLALSVGEGISTEFQIRKRHPNWQKSILMGKLTINIIAKHQIVESFIDTYHSQFISQTDFEDENPIIIEFIATKSDSQVYKNKVYRTSVDQNNKYPHGEKITIFVGFDQTTANINSINYVQTRNRVGEQFTEIVYTKEQQHQIFKYIQVQKKSLQEQESFWTKYKWYLIIGGVVVYTLLTFDTDKAQGAAATR